jgi:hypothetical protein
MKSLMSAVIVLFAAGVVSADCHNQAIVVQQQVVQHAQQVQVQYVQQQRVQRVVVVEQPVQQIVVQRQQVQHVQAARQQVVVQQVVQQQRVRQNDVQANEVRQRGLINISRGGSGANQSGFLGLPSLINIAR